MRITRASIIGASTSRAHGKTRLTLSCTGQGRLPLALVFNDDATCAIARGALGIGNAGFGVLHYRLGPQHGAGFARILRLLGAASCAVYIFGWLISLIERVIPALGSLAVGDTTRGLGSAFALILALPTMVMLFIERHQSTLELSPRGVTLRAAAALSAQWATIRDVTVDLNQLRIEMKDRDTLPIIVPVVTASLMREGVAPTDIERATGDLNTCIERAQANFSAADPLSMRV